MDQNVAITVSYDEEIQEWGAWIEGVAAFGQGETREEALEDLKRGLALYMDTVGKDRFYEEIASLGNNQVVSVPLASLV